MQGSLTRKGLHFDVHTLFAVYRKVVSFLLACESIKGRIKGNRVFLYRLTL